MRSIRMQGARALAGAALFVMLGALGVAQEVDKALAAFKAGEWKKAAEIAANVPADSKDFARGQYLCGEAMLVLGDAENAAQCFQRVLEKNPKALPASIGLGRALTAQSKLEDAEKVLVEAMKADPKDVSAKLAVGAVHVKLNKLKEAKAELGDAYALDPKNPAVVQGWCDYLWAEGDNAKAAQVAASLTKAMPKHPMGPFLEAIAYERDNKDKKAIEAYEEALKRDPNFLDAHKNLAILCHTRNPMYQDAERTDKSLEHYERYFALGGKDPELENIYKQFKGFMDSYREGK